MNSTENDFVRFAADEHLVASVAPLPRVQLAFAVDLLCCFGFYFHVYSSFWCI